MLPVGSIFWAVYPEDKEVYIPAVGQYLTKDMYPDLYKAIGDNYCQPFIEKALPFTLLEKVKLFFSIHVPIKYIKEQNPLYVHNEFRLPDLRGNYINGN